MARREPLRAITHPWLVAARIAEDLGGRVRLEFARYVDRDGVHNVRRDTFRASAGSIDGHWLEEHLDGLTPGEELALNSRVYGAARGTRHIPMIDFAEGVDLASARSAIQALYRLPDDGSRPALPERLPEMSFLIFDSGRSHHAYGTSPVAPGHWHAYLGDLLLLNPRGRPAIIDTRWIGHALRHGFAALRWSCATKSYAALPRLVGELHARPTSTRIRMAPLGGER